MKTTQRAMKIRNEILEASARQPCPRCDGAGIREDNPRWVPVEENGVFGKVCFRCRGVGFVAVPIEDPLTLRYRTIRRLVPLVDAGEIGAIEAMAREAMADRLMWPIVEDAYERAHSAAERNFASAYFFAEPYDNHYANFIG